jgi:hypothetical protein
MTTWRWFALSIIAVAIAGCDFAIDSSKFNVTDEQFKKLSSVDIVDRDEFKIDMRLYLAQQLAAIETKIIAANKAKALSNPEFGQIQDLPSLCSPDEAVFAMTEATGLLDTGLRGLATDPVMIAILQTAQLGLPTRKIEYLESNPQRLGYREFEAFRRKISAAGLSGATGSWLSNDDEARMSLLADAIGTSDVPMLKYFSSYYKGSFVDRFGNTIEKPSIENGIEDGTISGFLRVLLEYGVDVSPLHEPTLVDALPPTTYYPKGNESQPTFYKVFEEGEKVVAHGKDGVSAAESRIIEMGSNLIADSGMTALSGLFEFLGGIDIGLIVTPNFAIGGNDTLKTLVRTVFETAMRRGAEVGLYCIVKRYDIDDIANAIDN